MPSMKKWFIPNLTQFVKNKEEFDKFDTHIQNKICKFLEYNKEIAENNRFVKKAAKEIRLANARSKKLKHNITKIYPIIKNLPNGYSLSEIYVEKDRNSYRLDIHWIGIRKKCSLGTNLKKIETICKKYNIDSKIKLTESNYKEVIRQSLNDELNDFLIECGYQNIRDCSKIYLENSVFKIKKSMGVDTNKKDYKKPTTNFYSENSQQFYGGNSNSPLLKMKDKNPLKKPKGVDDTPNRLRFSTEKKINFKKKK